jgi:mono/diheme cytochrome c family protein
MNLKTNLTTHIFNYIKDYDMKKTFLMAAATVLVLSGCSSDYTPNAGTSGEEIFKAACMECHEAVAGKENIFYEIPADKHNLGYITGKISSGSMSMPKFPNITGNELNAISTYVLEHSVAK